MDLLEIFTAAVALAMDAFSVSISAGMIIKKPGFGHYFRLSFHFGLFQFMMPIAGYFFGSYLESYIKDYDHWVAFGLLVFIGLKMIREAFSKKEEVSFKQKDPSRGFNLVLLAVATSIDALAVGLSLGVLNQPVLFPGIVIGITCSLFSIAGVFIGKKAGNVVGRKAEAIGGIMLLIIGVKILYEHLI
ncbi:MAG: manganese efflux pump [Candidatus Aminicenantes bacterium]|nr:manganese efflux pump [Candidatus Aminicenantes bacterium]